MPFRAAIVEDNAADAEYVENILRRWADARDCAVSVERFPSAERFLFRYGSVVEPSGRCRHRPLLPFLYPQSQYRPPSACVYSRTKSAVPPETVYSANTTSNSSSTQRPCSSKGWPACS